MRQNQKVLYQTKNSDFEWYTNLCIVLFKRMTLYKSIIYKFLPNLTKYNFCFTIFCFDEFGVISIFIIKYNLVDILNERYSLLTKILVSIKFNETVIKFGLSEFIITKDRYSSFETKSFIIELLTYTPSKFNDLVFDVDNNFLMEDKIDKTIDKIFNL